MCLLRVITGTHTDIFSVATPKQMVKIFYKKGQDTKKKIEDQNMTCYYCSSTVGNVKRSDFAQLNSISRRCLSCLWT